MILWLLFYVVLAWVVHTARMRLLRLLKHDPPRVEEAIEMLTLV